MKEKKRKINSLRHEPAVVLRREPEVRIIEWEAPEYEYRPKDVSWYWLSLILGIVLIALAVWQKNFLFAIFIAIAWTAIVSLAGKYPSYWKFAINEKGISVWPSGKPESEKKIYTLTEIHGFDIHSSEGEDYGELIIRMKSKFSPYLKISLHKEKEREVAEFLAKYLAKEEYAESVVDSLSKMIGF